MRFGAPPTLTVRQIITVSKKADNEFEKSATSEKDQYRKRFELKGSIYAELDSERRHAKRSVPIARSQ